MKEKKKPTKKNLERLVGACTILLKEDYKVPEQYAHNIASGYADVFISVLDELSNNEWYETLDHTLDIAAAGSRLKAIKEIYKIPFIGSFLKKFMRGEYGQKKD